MLLTNIKIETTNTGWVVGDYFISFSGIIYTAEGKHARCLPSFLFDLKNELINEHLGGF